MEEKMSSMSAVGGTAERSVSFEKLAGAGAVLAGIVHFLYAVANLLNPPASAPADLPSQIDPRGLLTFGVMGLGLLVIAWLMGRSEEFQQVFVM
jgi:hypothetical protein